MYAYVYVNIYIYIQLYNITHVEQIFNVSRNGLEPDIRTVLDRGLDCLLAYMRKWRQVDLSSPLCTL